MFSFIDCSWAFSDRVPVARATYAGIAAMVVSCLSCCTSAKPGQTAFSSLHRAMALGLGAFGALCLLLHKPHNLVLIPVFGLQLAAFRQWAVHEHRQKGDYLTTVTTTSAMAYLLGRAAFFALGNSNSPSSIDISGAYAGYVHSARVACRSGA